MDIRIVDVEWALDDAGATYQAYVVEIARGLKTWAVRRRYSAFDDLRRAVSKELGPLASPFPGKNLFGRADPAKRQRELEAWLRSATARLRPKAVAVDLFLMALMQVTMALVDEAPRRAIDLECASDVIAALPVLAGPRSENEGISGHLTGTQ